ncbi:RNA/RNP complex-1-interacting phosphatase isoform X2 [Rana temporaria]|uniref:RNA/RNP complex-1-interacting phosphatase isoform X2 n=1 Tax=Rana temporaria TaxID=8407 RepID=UPI001AADAF4D|nr:RNA/RNP complex-1-interacting phosphatase isoform X2 [Rana temporaria]
MLGGLTGFWFRFSRNSSASRRLHRTSADMKTHLPERWTEYSAVGRRIPGTRFISFKVPLQKVFENKLAPLQRFSPSDLLREMEKQKEELGLVVDLTFTKRYYSPQEFPASVKYVKIFTAGKQVPSDDVIYEFKCLVKRFLSENAENDKLVGVHCTHGLNRTGYLVCRYMIDVLGVVPSEAIERFNKSRGHCIERENYLDDLLEGKPRSNQGSDRSVLPKARHQQHTPGMKEVADFRPPLYPQSWFPGYPFINHRPRIPPPGFPHPPLPGHRIPQTDLRGGPQRHRHHPKRYFAQQPDDRPVNGAPGWHPTPPNYGDSIDSRGSGPQGRNGPYSRWPGQGHRGSHGEQ